MDKHTFLAFDLGATSGRAVAGTLHDGRLTLEEIHRFPNAIMELHGKFYWNIYSLYNELKQALAMCKQRGIAIHSIGIDTWGVDFGYIADDGSILGLPRAYRDPYTDKAPEELFKIIPRDEVYARTGIQIMNFNTLYQLFAAKREGYAPLKNADKILFMPDLLAYMLTGSMVCEYTEASTSQMVCPESKQFDKELVEAVGLPTGILLPIVMPGTLIGTLSDSIAAETGVGKVPVYAVAGHDTASAIAAIPANDKEFVFLSSGTWSLMGIECEKPIINSTTGRLNLTNEGGIDGTTCFLNNITGMWLLEQCRKEWQRNGKEYSYGDIIAMAREATPFRSLVDPNDALFANPKSMQEAIADYCRRTAQPAPGNDAQTVRAIFDSLALCYRDTLESMRRVSPHDIKRLHIIGGGSKNAFMSQLTANATGVPVVAGPSEATAIGNCMVQARAAGLAGDRWEMRALIARAVETETFAPCDREAWESAYTRYKSITTGKKQE